MLRLALAKPQYGNTAGSSLRWLAVCVVTVHKFDTFINYSEFETRHNVRNVMFWGFSFGNDSDYAFLVAQY